MYKPLLLKDVVLSLDADAGGVGTPVDFAVELTQVEFTPSASQQTLRTLSPDGVYTETSQATWTCTLGYVQDWDATTSLSRFLFDNEGKEVPVIFEPRSGTGTRWSATLVITPGAIGGQVDAWAQTSVTLGVKGRPTPTAIT